MTATIAVLKLGSQGISGIADYYLSESLSEYYQNGPTPIRFLVW